MLLLLTLLAHLLLLFLPRLMHLLLLLCYHARSCCDQLLRQPVLQ